MDETTTLAHVDTLFEAFALDKQVSFTAQDLVLRFARLSTDSFYSSCVVYVHVSHVCLH